ncbi:microtubule-associated protein 4-like isoform X1 [Hypanus sabinus]|uniref:microtubule-associated protein 4-like isoform X1 n=1 Tax=Hypanus sabinus TaxID=79690 RepID=UPI0028C3BA2A|nr:microtubule-associated protein 4-like isoform X1 [Hypanus sabinus]XP_059829823.1 microtubule-associated protein 4-like isoform X1 [Hypanus sabinus]XP_059829827.1 microtubule-associated protein 4-like isoform X1 [Hypanus sabinus]
MADLDLVDALHESTPSVELEVKRDFISSLEAEKYDDVVGESVTKESYVPLLDDETKLSPSEAEGKAVGNLCDDTVPERDAGGQLAERSSASEQGPGELPNGKHGETDSTEMHNVPVGDELLNFGNKHYDEEEVAMNLMSQSAQMSTESPFRLPGTIEEHGAEELLNFESMQSPAHEIKGSTTSSSEPLLLNSPTEVTEEPMFEEKENQESVQLSIEEMASQEEEIVDSTLKTRVTELEGNLVAEVRPLEEDLEKTELPMMPTLKSMESAQTMEEELGVPFTSLTQVETSYHPVDCSDPSLSSAVIMDDHLVSNVMKTEVTVNAELQAPINNSLQQENLGHGTEAPMFTEPLPPSSRNTGCAMDTMVLTSSTMSTVAPVSPLERAPKKDKLVNEVREIAQAKEPQVAKVPVEKKKKKKKRSHPKASQPVGDVPAKAKDVHKIISAQRLEELPAGVIPEHKEIVLNTERSFKKATGMKEKAKQVDNASSQGNAWVTGSAGDKMATAPVQSIKAASEGHKTAMVGSQKGELTFSESSAQVESISEVELIEHPLDSWNREVTSLEPVQAGEVEKVIEPPLEEWSGENASCKSQEESKENKLVVPSLELRDIDNAPSESKEMPEIKEIGGSYLEHMDPKTIHSGSKQPPKVEEIVETPLENSREITAPVSQESSKVGEAQTLLKLGGEENDSPKMHLSPEVIEMAEPLTENLGRETSSLERKEVPEIREMASTCVEQVASEDIPTHSEHLPAEGMVENSQLVSKRVAPPESGQTSEMNKEAEIRLDHMGREMDSLDSQQMPLVKEIAEMLIDDVDIPLESNKLPKVEEVIGHSLEQVDRQAIPQHSEETAGVTKLAESPLTSMYVEAGVLEPEQVSELKDIVESSQQHLSEELGSLELMQTNEVKEIVEPSLTRESGVVESQHSSEVMGMIETPLEHANTEVTPLDLQHTAEETWVADASSELRGTELTSTESQQNSEIKKHESPPHCWDSESASPELQQSSEMNEMTESLLECQTEVKLSECTDQVASLSLKQEASKAPDNNEGKSPKSPLRKGGAKLLQKQGFMKGISQKETGAKVSPEQHRALKTSIQPKVTKVLNQRRGDNVPVEPKDYGDVNAQSNQGHLDEGTPQDEAKPEETTAENVTKRETAAVSKELPVTPDAKGKVGTLTTKISPTKTKPQPSASLKRPAAAVPSPNKKINTTTMMAATTSKRLPSSPARSFSATTKDVKPKATESKSPTKPPSSRPPSAGVTKTPSNTTVKSSTTSLQKGAATAGSTPRNTTASTPRRPTSIKTEPKSTEVRKPLSAKSPLGETGRLKATSATSIKSAGTTPSTPSTPLGVSSPGTPSSNTSRAPRTLALKTTAASEAKRVTPISRTASKPTVAAVPKQPRPASAPAPDLKNVKSKIGSTDNIKHQPGGGKAKSVEKKPDPVRLNRKVEPSTVNRVAKTTATKDSQKQTNGKVQIVNKKVDYSHVQSKCGSKDNIKHVPGGGNVQIPKAKVDVNRVSSKCGSKTNLKHKAGGGDVKIETSKTNFKNKAESKIGSLDNLNHTPGGGNVKNEGEEESETAAISQTPENRDLTGEAESETQQNGVGVDPTAGSDETHNQELQMQETY